MELKTYTKINTMYKRYIFDASKCPKKKWLQFRNKIILGEFSNKEVEYLFNCLWEATSKIDGTNSKIVFFPSTQKIYVGGKTEKAESLHGQFEMLQEIGERIKPKLCELLPKECAVFAPTKSNNKTIFYDIDGNEANALSEGMYQVKIEEVPIYIYGEYFGNGVQKCGKRYLKDGNNFLVFDIQKQGWWMPKTVLDETCENLGLKTVPFLGTMTLKEIEEKVRNGFTTQVENASDPTLIEEGIVARPTVTFGNQSRIIVKVKHCDYVQYDEVRKDFSDEEFKEFDDWYHTFSNAQFEQNGLL